jgi:16S rRNA (uracil1498-N3)-methyltransferase
MHGKILSFEKKPRSKYHIWLLPPQMNDRFQLFLEKATEIGIHEITPIYAIAPAKSDQ